MSKINAALYEYNLDIGTFPSNLEQLVYKSPEINWLGPYIKQKDLTDPWGNLYHYELKTDQQSFVLYSLGSDQHFSGKALATDMILISRNVK